MIVHVTIYLLTSKCIRNMCIKFNVNNKKRKTHKKGVSRLNKQNLQRANLITM